MFSSRWPLLAFYGGLLCCEAVPLNNQAVLTTQETTAFGIGFDLSASYGAVAASFTNGTVVTLATVLASDGYREVLQRLSLDSSKHLSPPYENVGDSVIDMPRQMLRKARKAAGLPASRDVGYLAEVLVELRKQAENRIRQPIESAGLATLNLVALYQEDLEDAFLYAGMKYMKFPVTYEILHETNAAYAGYGFGLCSDYKDKWSCRRQQKTMAADTVLAVSYTRGALTVALSVTRSAYYLWETPLRHLLDFSLGHDAAAHDDKHWTSVGMRLEELFVTNPNYPRPSKVLLMGDCVGDDTFQDVLRHALSNQMKEMPEILSEDAEGVVARGTAEFAKRLPYDPYKPLL